MSKGWDGPSESAFDQPADKADQSRQETSEDRAFESTAMPDVFGVGDAPGISGGEASEGRDYNAWDNSSYRTNAHEIERHLDFTLRTTIRDVDPYLDVSTRSLLREGRDSVEALKSDLEIEGAGDRSRESPPFQGFNGEETDRATDLGPLIAELEGAAAHARTEAAAPHILETSRLPAEGADTSLKRTDEIPEGDLDPDALKDSGSETTKTNAERLEEGKQSLERLLESPEFVGHQQEVEDYKQALLNQAELASGGKLGDMRALVDGVWTDVIGAAFDSEENSALGSAEYLLDGIVRPWEK